ncbi:AraC family transcriptional regulator [Carboxylicivirga sediminis]|uniref:AraC family transcriptional regulator n=1 Tax=Carboxylicivirga sediminis TaxID=2006564 RepID=A0A941IXE6_9BACT|nr:AraC family transcriptional regulator [Carboxylicivirga sediminis]MBR8536686.1 AraC family transcriptional regulator [Carboxylicivirga sediminis]
MKCEGISYSIDYDLKNIACSRFDTSRHYTNVISPFSRIYLITEGKGSIMIHDEKIILEPNNLYLIPSFTPCSYTFDKELEHYYIHFSTMLPNGLNVYSLYETIRKVACKKIDHLLFKQLLAINPDKELPHHHPGIYQTKSWMNKANSYHNVADYIETKGILEQLFSRFIVREVKANLNEMIRYQIPYILEYIQSHLNEQISINTLAEKACLSRDHFARVFKSILSVSPCEFIIKKRIEKAQFLLLTTDLPIKRIIEDSGFRSLTYFSRIFKKYTSLTPLEYRRRWG